MRLEDLKVQGQPPPAPSQALKYSTGGLECPNPRRMCHQFSRGQGGTLTCPGSPTVRDEATGSVPSSPRPSSSTIPTSHPTVAWVTSRIGSVLSKLPVCWGTRQGRGRVEHSRMGVGGVHAPLPASPLHVPFLVQGRTSVLVPALSLVPVAGPSFLFYARASLSGVRTPVTSRSQASR